MWDPPPEHPLRRMFAGLAEHAFFSHLGVADPPLIDYLSALLTRFIHFDAVYRLRDAAGSPLTELTEMVIEAEQLPAGGRTRRDYYRHIGDFALFWTGRVPRSGRAAAVARVQGRDRELHRAGQARLPAHEPDGGGGAPRRGSRPVPPAERAVRGVCGRACGRCARS